MTDTPATQADLLPCPFGCAPEDAAGPTLAYIGSTVRSEGGSITCDTCGCDGPWCATEAEAIAAWNTRSAQATLLAEAVEVLEPFAAKADKYEANHPPSQAMAEMRHAYPSDAAQVQHRLGDFRRARAFLAKVKP